MENLIQGMQPFRGPTLREHSKNFNSNHPGRIRLHTRHWSIKDSTRRQSCQGFWTAPISFGFARNQATVTGAHGLGHNALMFRTTRLASHSFFLP